MDVEGIEPELVESIEAGHARRHAEVGTTYHIWFDGSTPFDEMESLMDGVINAVYDKPWDTAIWAGRPE